MIKLTIATRIALAIGVLVLLFFGTTIVAYMLTERTSADAFVEPILLYLSIMTALGGLVGAGAALILIRGIVYPIAVMTKGVEAFDRGNLSHRITSLSTDELGLLADALNAMAESRQKTEARLEDLAFSDPLTSLPNRAHFQERLADAIANAARDDGMVAVQLLDLDHFKQINDTLGHPVGDELLRQVSGRLLECIRDTDTVARLGGDEFAIIQNHLHEKIWVERLAQRAINRVAEKFEIDGDRLHTGTSIGIAIYPNDADNPDDLLRSADLALYRAKNAGRGSYYLYDMALDHEVKQRMELENDLREALANDALHLNYQPKLQLKSGNVTGAEALIRWQHASRGVVATDKFIAAAEQSGLVIQLTDFVLRQACRDAKTWKAAGLNGFRVSVNLSAMDFKRKDFLNWLVGILGDGEHDPANLTLEITERTLMDNDEALQKLLRSLRDMGVEISIDDFGTGYSSLQYLKNFPVSSLKIDKTFVNDVATDKSDANITRSIVTMAHGLDMKVIAEGVETVEQMEFLERIGCDEIQGYLFSTPLSPGDFSNFLKNHNGE